jgi:hypothetical protein
MKKTKMLLMSGTMVLLSVIVFMGCSEITSPNQSTAMHDEQSEIQNLDVQGMVIYQNGKEILSMETDGNVYGQAISSYLGKEQLFEVEFLDDQGDVVDLESEILSFDWVNDAADLCTFEKHPHLGKWKFCITGKKTGDTTFELVLVNKAIVEYKSPKIPVKVM